MRAVSALAGLLFVFAGCLGGGEVAPEQLPGVSSEAGICPTDPPQPDCGPGDEAGAIEGFVFDEEELPILGVQVGILGMDAPVEMVTDGRGYYTFGNVYAGFYQLGFAKLGFHQDQRAVEVFAGEVTVVNMTLIKDEPPAVYHDDQVFDGNILLGEAFLDIITGTFELPMCEPCQYEFNVTSNAKSIVLEPFFEPTIANPAGPTVLGFQFWNKAKLESGNLSQTPYASGEWASGDKIQVDFDFETGEVFRLVNYCDVEWVCIDQDFSIYVTIFYNGVPDPDFTALPE